MEHNDETPYAVSLSERFVSSDPI